MQFKIGDLVVHPTYGISDIVEIEEKMFAGQGTRLYYKFVLPRHTSWIPVEAQEASGLRLVTARSELEDYRTVLKSAAVSLGKNHPRRHLELADRLKQGSFQVMCEVVRDLTASSRQKPLGRSNAMLLQKTRGKLFQEWAASAGVSVAEVTKEINTLLLATQPTSNEGEMTSLEK